MQNLTKSIAFTAFGLPPRQGGPERPRLRRCNLHWSRLRAQGSDISVRHEDHGFTHAHQHRFGVRSRRHWPHPLEPARPLPPAGAPWWRHDPAPGLRRRPRRHRRRARGDLRPAGPGQHLRGDPCHRAHHSPAFRYPLADHGAVVPGVDRGHCDAALGRPPRTAADGRASDGRLRVGRPAPLPPAQCAARSHGRPSAHSGLRRLQPALPNPPAGRGNGGRVGRPAVLEPSDASPGDRRDRDRRALCGGRRLRPPTWCHCRGDRWVGYGGRLPPGHGRAQRSPVRGRGDRCGPRPTGRSPRVDLHVSSGVGRGVLHGYGRGGPGARTCGLRARCR